MKYGFITKRNYMNETRKEIKLYLFCKYLDVEVIFIGEMTSLV
jgi:hypothetical protein